jgi:hypothetical protein
MQAGSGALPLTAMAALEESGFVVLPGPFPVEQLGAVADAYDAEVSAAVGDDVRVGSTSTRVVDFVNRGPLFDPLYVYPPLPYGRVTSRVQWVDMARPGCQRLQPATSVAAGRVHSARWSGRYRLLRTDESRDPRATWYRRASGAGAPRLVLPRTSSLCRRTIDRGQSLQSAR